MKTREWHLDRWALPPLGAIAATMAADLLLGRDVVLIALLVAGPLLAALRLDPRQTALVAALALLGALVLGAANGFFGELDHLTRTLPVAVGGALGVWAAHLRTQRERAALGLALQGSVSRILNESSSLADAAPRILRVIGEALGWQVGTLWEPDPSGKRLRGTERWTAPGFEAPGFEAVGEEHASEPRAGLPGRALESGLPTWTSSLRRDPDSPRAAAARAAGLEAGFAFPVRRGERVVGVVEFFSTSFPGVDRALLELLSGLGAQIGQYVERARAERQREELLGREHATRLAAERAERSGAETVALLDTLIGRAPVGFAFVDPGLRYVRVNDAFAAASGSSREELMARTVPEAIPGLPEVGHHLRHVLTTGEPVIEAELSGQTAAAPGVERHWLASYYPVRAEDGELLGVGVLVVEITDQKRAEGNANFLGEATAALNASLDYELTLANVARLTVPYLADWCMVDIVVPGGHLKRLAIAHADPSKEDLLRELNRRYPVDRERDVGVAHTIRTGESRLYRRVDDALLQAAAQDESHLRILRELGLKSGMTVPLTARSQVLGAVSFASAESGRLFDHQDLALAEELGRRAGAAVENARLYEERTHIARTLQASLLPPRLPDIPNVELAARHRAAGAATDVGGDFYDVFPTGHGRWAAVVGDVLGKGPAAAAVIGLARHTLRAVAMRETGSAEILEALNEALSPEGTDDGFCTVVYAALEEVDDRLSVELTSAGHPLPLLLRGDGTVETAGRPGTLLGAVTDLELHPERIELAPREALVMVTDGVLEARSEEGLFGERRLERLLGGSSSATARELAERVERHAVEFQGGEPRDDLAVLVVRRPAADRAEPLAAAGLPTVEGEG